MGRAAATICSAPTCARPSVRGAGRRRRRRSRARTVTPTSATRRRNAVSASSSSTAPMQLVVGERYVVEPDAEAESRRPAGRCRTGPRTAAARSSACRSGTLSVVVLLPPWVITRSTCGNDRSSAALLRAPHMLSASSYSSACGPLLTMKRCGVRAEHVDQPPHQVDVGAAERAERQVDRALSRRAARARSLGQLEVGSSVVRT